MVDTELTLTGKRQDALLIIDDNPASQKQLSHALESETSIITAPPDSVSSALNQVLTSVVVVGQTNTTSLSLVKEILMLSPRTKVVMVIDKEKDSDPTLALEAGAFDIIERPFNDDLLRMIVKRSRYIAKLEIDIGRLKAFERQQRLILGGSAPMVQTLKMVDRVASTDVSTLIYGESGTGKALLARAIHDRSGRSGKPFVTVNCASIPEDLLDSELFGIEKGNFDSRQVKVGKIETAQEGTLFLDEVGDMPLLFRQKYCGFCKSAWLIALQASARFLLM
nr:sigma 54-interacting transcriptional regulator [Grimontia hollisae]